jgi:hypothetical protein
MGKEIDVDLLGVAMTTGQGVLTMNEVFFESWGNGSESGQMSPLSNPNPDVKAHTSRNCPLL